MGQAIRVAVYIVSFFGGAAAGLFIYFNMPSAESAPQQASVAATAAAITVIGYVGARSIALITRAGETPVRT